MWKRHLGGPPTRSAANLEKSESLSSHKRLQTQEETPRKQGDNTHNTN